MNGPNYTKLSKNIIYSSLFQEKPEYTKVWVAFLCLKDAEQIVRQNITGIARICNLSVAMVEEAVNNFESIDQRSTSKKEDGRKLVVQPNGGWLVVNGEDYEELGWSDSKKEYERKRKAEYRAKTKGLTGGNVQDLPPAPPGDVPHGTNGSQPALSGNRLHGIPSSEQECIDRCSKILPEPVPADIARDLWDYYESTRRVSPSGDIFWADKNDVVINQWEAKARTFNRNAVKKAGAGTDADGRPLARDGKPHVKVDPKSAGYLDPKLRGTKGQIW